MSYSDDLLGGLARARTYRSRRVSSYDTSGANIDARPIKSGERLVLADIEGAGVIKHLWFTINCHDKHYPRSLVFRAWWDGEEQPSIECPVGDFFGVGHGRVSNYMSLPLNMVSGSRALELGMAAMNCFFAMPFRKGARLEIENQSPEDVLSFYYYVDYEEHDSLPDDILYFHCQWNREPITKGYETWMMDPHDLFGKKCNTTGDENYVVFEAEGRGHHVGCTVSIRNVMYNNVVHTWWGEGDDMIFVDGEKWPPSLHGTGTEDYFCAAWGFPSGQTNGIFHGVSLAGNVEDWGGEWSLYRFHLESPVTFTKSIRVTIEHGHDNNRYDDWSSAGYWYQSEPHRPFPELPGYEARKPRK